jgi:hypothetical protein
MTDLIKQFEAVPAAYPTAPAGLSTAAAALDADMIWARIESYTAHRFSERAVTWTIAAGAADEWELPLAPLVSQTAERWTGTAWETATSDAGPVGLFLPSADTFRITAQVGAGPVPAPVSEAFRRLAEYLADDPGTAGASSTSVAIGPIQEELTRNPAWVARAMQYSGAGDLLRPYRRA